MLQHLSDTHRILPKSVSLFCNQAKVIQAVAHLWKHQHWTCPVSERVAFFYKENLFARDLTDLAIYLFVNVPQFFHIYKVQY